MAVDSTSVQAPEVLRRRPRAVRVAGKVLSHPVVLILVGAAVSGVVVPDITRSWQDHQRALDLKGSVIREINTSTGAVLGTIRLVAVESGPAGEHELDAAFGRWQISSNDVRAQLSTYFPDPSLVARWQKYQEGVLYLYAFFKYRTTGQRSLGMFSLGQEGFPSLAAVGRFPQLLHQQIERADTFTGSASRQRVAIAYLDEMNTLLSLFSHRADEIDSLVLHARMRL